MSTVPRKTPRPASEDVAVLVEILRALLHADATLTAAAGSTR